MKNNEALNVAKNKHVVEIDISKKKPERVIKTICILVESGYEWIRIHDAVKEVIEFNSTLFVVGDSYNNEFYIYLE